MVEVVHVEVAMNTVRLQTLFACLLGAVSLGLIDALPASAAAVSTAALDCWCEPVVISEGGGEDVCCWCEEEGADPEIKCFNDIPLN
jgi:hypothetical protein